MRIGPTDAEIIAFIEAARPADKPIPRDNLPGSDECWRVRGEGHARRWCRAPVVPGVSFCPACCEALRKADR